MKAATDFRSFCEAFQHTAGRVPDRMALARLDGSGLTWAQYAAEVEAKARILSAQGVRRGDVVALMLTNRPEFHVWDAAAMHLGATTVSVYNTYPPDEVGLLLEDAGARVGVSEPDLIDKLAPAVDTAIDVDGDLAPLGSDDALDFEGAWRAVGPDDLVVLIYTSGTTGPPKGVELTHGALLATLHGMHLALDSIDGAHVVSFLPYAHIAERQFTQYRPMVYGFTTADCPGLPDLPKYLVTFQPQYLFTPPRLLEKFRGALEANAPAEVFEVGRRRVELLQAGEPVPDELEQQWQATYEQAYKPMLAKLGLGGIAASLAGSTPVPPDLHVFWRGLGLRLGEAWGMTECAAFGSFTRMDEYAIGTQGSALPGTELRIADDGEILLKSPFLMRGYRNQPEATAEAIRDGWLHTGDIGELDERGDLRITDRKKELIINISGKNMSPAYIEHKLKEAGDLVGQAMAIGTSRRYNVALLILDPEVVPKLAEEYGGDVASLAEHPEVLERVGAGVDRANERMARVEQIKRWKLLGDEWLPGGEELTPTMKLKRQPIEAKYAAEIEALYAEEPAPA